MRLQGLRLKNSIRMEKRCPRRTRESRGINLNTKDVQLSQSIRLRIPQEDLSLETNSLFWANANRLLSAGKEEPVLVKRSDGTIIGDGVSPAPRRTGILNSPTGSLEFTARKRKIHENFLSKAMVSDLSSPFLCGPLTGPFGR